MSDNIQFEELPEDVQAMFNATIANNIADKKEKAKDDKDEQS